MSNNHTKTVSLNGFEEEVIQSELPVVIDFWAPWCAPCHAIAPLLEQLAEQYAGRVKVVKINVDEEQGLASIFRISGIPTLIAIHGDQVVHTQVGLSAPDALKSLFAGLASRSDAEPQATHRSDG